MFSSGVLDSIVTTTAQQWRIGNGLPLQCTNFHGYCCSGFWTI